MTTTSPGTFQRHSLQSSLAALLSAPPSGLQMFLELRSGQGGRPKGKLQ